MTTTEKLNNWLAVYSDVPYPTTVVKLTAVKHGTNGAKDALIARIEPTEERPSIVDAVNELKLIAYSYRCKLVRIASRKLARGCIEILFTVD